MTSGGSGDDPMISDNDEDDDIPDADVCDRLCKEFAQITNTDTAFGHFFLQEAKWKVEVALNNYFSSQGSSPSGNTSSATGVGETSIPLAAASGRSLPSTLTQTLIESPSEPVSGGGQTEARGQSSDVLSSKRDADDTAGGGGDEKLLRLLSWNIDGLDPNGCDIRTKAVCTIVLKEKPTIAFFQEVIDKSVKILADYLSDDYWVLKGKEPGAPSDVYYTAMLLKRSAVNLGNEPEVIPFYESLMGRSLLKIELEIFGSPCILMTSHLESTKDHSRQRVQQLRRCFDVLEKNVPDNAMAFFGGDLNLRDEEVEQVGGIPNGVQDLWEACGSPKSCQYTWDCRKNDNLNAFEGAKFKPRARFDRLYFKPRANAEGSKGDHWKPESFTFVGTERIRSYNRFPSDHWGIICDLVKI